MIQSPKCPNCSAPAAIHSASHIVTCEQCGACFPLDESIASNPQWQRHWQKQQVDAWYETERAALLVVDRLGNKVPPPKESNLGMGIMMGGFVIGFVISAFVMFVGVLFPPLWLLLPFTFFGFMFGGGVWGAMLNSKATDRYKRYQQLEAEYMRRVEALAT